MTPVFSIVQRRSLLASQRTTLAFPWFDLTVGVDADEFELGLSGGKSLATHRSPWGEGVRR